MKILALLATLFICGSVHAGTLGGLVVGAMLSSGNSGTSTVVSSQGHDVIYCAIGYDENACNFGDPDPKEHARKLGYNLISRGVLFSPSGNAAYIIMVVDKVK